MTTIIKPGTVDQAGDTIVPVSDALGNALPIGMIKWYVDQVMQFARMNRSQTFKVSPNGWRYHRTQIAPLFDHCPDNVTLPYEFVL